MEQLGSRSGSDSMKADPSRDETTSFSASRPSSIPDATVAQWSSRRTSIASEDTNTATSPTSYLKSPPESPSHHQSSVHFHGAVRLSTSLESRESRKTSESFTEPNAVDQAWGILFDSRGYPTQRLEEVLRGLANYIVSTLSDTRLGELPDTVSR